LSATGIELRECSSASSKVSYAKYDHIFSRKNKIIKRNMRRAGHVASMGKVRNSYNILVRKPEGKRPHGRPRRGWKYNNRIDLRETGWEVE
jgi:hypothetical protein